MGGSEALRFAQTWAARWVLANACVARAGIDFLCLFTQKDRATSRDHVVRGYQMLERSLADAANFIVHAFDTDAAEVFDDLRRRGIRIGTMDLRIAAIALRHQLTLLTQNLVDFEKVPELSVADWASG